MDETIRRLQAELNAERERSAELTKIIERRTADGAKATARVKQLEKTLEDELADRQQHGARTALEAAFMRAGCEQLAAQDAARSMLDRAKAHGDDLDLDKNGAFGAGSIVNGVSAKNIDEAADAFLSRAPFFRGQQTTTPTGSNLREAAAAALSDAMRDVGRGPNLKASPRPASAADQTPSQAAAAALGGAFGAGKAR